MDGSESEGDGEGDGKEVCNGRRRGRRMEEAFLWFKPTGEHVSVGPVST